MMLENRKKDPHTDTFLYISVIFVFLKWILVPNGPLKIRQKNSEYVLAQNNISQ